MLIPFSYLFKKYNVKANGVLHIGAHLGQEYEAYLNEGVKNIIFVEANKQVFDSLCSRVNGSAVCLNACVTDKDGDTVTFNVSNNEGQSSSILPFGTHTFEHPGIVFTSRQQMTTTRIDTLMATNGLDMPNFVNIDIQGAELLALKGMDLSKVDYLYLEVNTKELYKGCALLHDLEAYLSDFKRVEIKMTPHGWGDAFYIRRTQTTLVVPDKFQPPHPIKYPTDNDPDFEKWYMQNYTGHEGRIYLPVMWTAYYCKHKYGADHTALEQLQKFLNSLDRTAKYYTVVQYDDGILNDVSHLDLKVFSMSGKGDYYLPLICKEHSFRHVRHSRSIFANFIGRNTHEIRREIFNIRKPGWHIEQKSHKLEVFCGILANSTFTLCPRGYGPTSFRIAEAMQYGSIPVYISDQFIEPHGINFNEYGIKVWPHQLHNLEAILNAVNVAEKQQAIKEYYPKYFTYDANKRIIRQEAGR
jgi:FkbM family methyltransferase